MLTNDQIEASKKWIESFYEILNSNDIDKLLEKYFKSDTELTYGNLPPLVGLEEIRATMLVQHSLVNVKHIVKVIDVLPDRIYVQTDNIFTVKNDPEQKSVEIKGITLFGKKIDERQTSKVEVYYDPAPVKERIKMTVV